MSDDTSKQALIDALTILLKDNEIVQKMFDDFGKAIVLWVMLSVMVGVTIGYILKLLIGV